MKPSTYYEAFKIAQRSHEINLRTSGQLAWYVVNGGEADIPEALLEGLRNLAYRRWRQCRKFRQRYEAALGVEE